MRVLLEMTLVGAMLIIVIVLIRVLLMNKLPKKTFVLLWYIALFQLLIPFSLPSQMSIFNLIDFRPYEAGISINPVADIVHLVIPDSIRQFHNQVSITDTSINSSNYSIISVPLMFIYLIGLSIAVMFFIMMYTRSRKEFKTSLPVSNEFILNWQEKYQIKRKINIRVSDKIAVPLTYGVLRPVILLPKYMNWDNESELGYILAHEFVHIKHFDALTKVVITVTLCIHWFNPFVWVMYFFFNRDIEISCDEAVVNMFGETSKQKYALTLISMMERRSHFPALYNNFSKYAIEERITAIMRIKKRTIVGTMATFLIVGATASVFATSGSNGIVPEVQASADLLQSKPSYKISTDEFIIKPIDDSSSILDSQYAEAEQAAYQNERMNRQSQEVMVQDVDSYSSSVYEIEYQERNMSFVMEDIVVENSIPQSHHVSLESAAKIAAEAIYREFDFSIDGMKGHMNFVDNSSGASWSGFILSDELIPHSESYELFYFLIDATTAEVTWLSMNTIEIPFHG